MSSERVEAKLEHDFRPVRLHRPDSDSQPGSNLLIRISLGQKPNNFHLARSRPRLPMPGWVRLIPGLEKTLQYEVGNSGGEKLLTRRDHFHGSYEVRCQIGFQDVGKGSCIEHPAHHLV